MGVRVGVSRRYRTRRGRTGSVWVIAPAGLVVLAVILLLPVFIDYWAVKALILVAAWATRTITAEVRRRRSQ
jgi:hypothetical protein